MGWVPDHYPYYSQNNDDEDQRKLRNISLIINNYPEGNFGNSFNVGDIGKVQVMVINTTGYALNNVYIKIYPHPNYPKCVSIEPALVWNDNHTFLIPIMDGEESIEYMKPGDSYQFYVRVKGIAAGHANLVSRISAEIVPYPTVDEGRGGFFDVFPPP